MSENASEYIKIPSTTPVRQRHWYKPVLIVVGTLAFGTLCFGLGRLSKIEEAKPDLVIENVQDSNPKVQSSGQVLSSQTSTSGGGAKGAYVASKNGTKYYLPSCSGVSRINEANKVWFATKEQAEAHGLNPASNCPGL